MGRSRGIRWFVPEKGVGRLSLSGLEDGWTRQCVPLVMFNQVRYECLIESMSKRTFVLLPKGFSEYRELGL